MKYIEYRLLPLKSAARWLMAAMVALALLLSLGLMVGMAGGRQVASQDQPAIAPAVPGNRSLEQADDPNALGWATSPTMTLLRWRWTGEEPEAFRIYRHDADLIGQVTPVTDQAQGIAILGSDWPWIREQYEVADFDHLREMLAADPLLAHNLMERSYRVAIVLGRAFTDTNIVPGRVYTYTVAAFGARKAETIVGQAVVTAGRVTVLPPPTGLVTVSVAEQVSGTAEANWAGQQRNRKIDRKLFLRWNTFSNPGATGWPDTWLAGYDVFRSASVSGPFVHINAEPIFPMPSYEPTGTLSYAQHDFYYVDDDPNLQYNQTYYYRVAGRDLLGQSRDWTTQSSQFSNYVIGVPKDTMPPGAPMSLTVSLVITPPQVILTWQPPEGEAASYYMVYRSRAVTASMQTPDPWICTDSQLDQCWQRVATPAGTTFVDTNIDIDLDYWYRMRAVDANGNLGPLSAPVWASVPDREGPADPNIYTDETGIIIIDPAPGSDTAVVHLYCAFGNESTEHYLGQKEVSGNNTVTFTMSSIYSPTFGVPASCFVQAFDAHGNKGNKLAVPTTGNWNGCLGPTTPQLPTPVITSVVTLGDAQSGYYASITWDIADDATLDGFHILRGELFTTTVITLTTVGPSQRTYEDNTILMGRAYSYTVAAYRSATTCTQADLARSTPYPYRAEPPLGEPRRKQEQFDWVTGFPAYTAGLGTQLYWQPQDVWQLYVVYRSFWPDHGYLQITPPIETPGTYFDNTAKHGSYWYIVLRLDPTTGEVAGYTEPATPGVPIASSKWRMADGKRQIANSRWQTASGKWRVASGKPKSEIPNIQYPTSNTQSSPHNGPALPPVLDFGDNLTITVSSYFPGSTLNDLNGTGVITLRPNDDPTPVELEFGHLAAQADGTVTSGEVEVPLPAQALSYPDSFSYEVYRLSLFPGGAWAWGEQALPPDLVLPELVLPPDAYESDNAYTAASYLAANSGRQTHNFHLANDVDWVRLELPEGVTVTMQTYELAANADTKIVLYDNSGTNQLVSNDDCEYGTVASCITWQTAYSGTYYLKVEPYNSAYTGWDSDYNLAAGIGFLFDIYEHDDSPQAATTIVPNLTTQSHNFHHPEDQDWIAFSAASGTEYRFRTFNLGANADTVLELYDTDGTTRLLQNDDCPGSDEVGPSCFDWTAPSTGTYYVRVTPYDQNSVGQGSNYQFNITTVVQQAVEQLQPNKEILSDRLAPAVGQAEVRGNLPWHYVRVNHKLELHDWTWLPPEQDCSPGLIQWTIRMESLPWLLAPLGTMTFGQQAVSFNSCTAYSDPYNGTRPLPSWPDANDAYLRPSFSSWDTAIQPGGLFGNFIRSSAAVNWTSPMPYGFYINFVADIELLIEDSLIQDGQIAGGEGALTFEYYDGMTPKHIEQGPNLPPLPGPGNSFSGGFASLDIEPGGALYGIVLPNNNVYLHWSQGSFLLDDPEYELVLPPVQSLELPQQEAIGGLSTHPELEVGLNRRTEDANFTWNHCAAEGGFLINFPGPVEADIYVRRGGISDLIDAHIPPGQPISIKLHGYPATLESFRVVWLDNFIYDRDVSAWVNLPYPAKMDIHMGNATINSNTGCVDGGGTDKEKKTAQYWNLELYPTSLAFRAPPPAPPPGATRTMWIQGKARIPHLTLPSASPSDRIPMEGAFAPNGDYHDFKFMQQAVTYKFDSFSYLLEKIRLSKWDKDAGTPGAQRELPTLEDKASLEPRPPWRSFSGFVGLKGVLTLPYLGPVKGPNLTGKPEIIVYAYEDWVGFNQRPRVKRLWTKLSKLTFDYYLTYAHSHDGQHTAIMVGWRQHDLGEVSLDSAVVVKPGDIGIYAGLSSGSAVLQALAETSGYTITNRFGPLAALGRSMSHWWMPKFTAPNGGSMDKAYVNLLARTWSVSPSYTVAETTKRLNKTHHRGSSPSGGGITNNTLTDLGLKLYDMRGQATYDATKDDMVSVVMSAAFKVDVGQAVPLLDVPLLSVQLTRDGKRLFMAKGIQVYLYKYDLPSVDLTLLLKSSPAGVEGGITLHDLKLEAIDIKRAGAVFGAGGDVLYLGAEISEAKVEDLGTVGGAFLLGMIQPSGPSATVLKNHGFSDLITHLGATPKPGGYTGVYARVYGDFPLVNFGCLLRVNVGGEVAIWIFAKTNDLAYGGRLRGFVHGKLICLVSARGDLTLELYRQAGADEHSFKGNFWVAGGIGFCDPGTWTSWESRWWGDSWCWTCGAQVLLEYNTAKKPGGWYKNMDSDCE